MKKTLLLILLIAVPGTWFTHYLKEVATVSYDNNNKMVMNQINDYSYETTLKFNSERSPSGWWGSIQNIFYPNIATYYQINSIKVTFGCWFSRDYGWWYKDFTFNRTLINYLNEKLSNGTSSFSFDYWGQQHTGGTKIYWTFPLKINGAVSQDFDPNWGGWVSWTRIGGVSIDLTVNVTNQFQKDADIVKTKMDTNVNNKTIEIESDFSSSLVDPNNIPAEKSALDTLIKQTLGSYYEKWKQYLGAYAYSDKTNSATVTMKFYNPATKNQVVWTFNVYIKVNLSKNYWDKTLAKRLTINPGIVMNDAGELVEDKPTKWQSKDVYGTTAQIVFDGAPDGSETMKVNGVPIETINNKFVFNMTDSQTKDNEDKPINEYHILLEKHDLKTWEVIGNHEVTYLIKQNVPPLALKWYSWDPDKPGNENQKSLITPSLPDGSPNPNYDREVNEVTGTKTQIIWVKHPADNPFPLDPLDKDGNVINNDSDYEPGFIAEGSVSGMGIQQLFSDPWVKTVTRAKVDHRLLNPTDKQIIATDDKGSYWSWAGNYHYLITDQKGATANKFILIGQDYQNKYLKFLDVLNNPGIAVDFWTTTQGLHLKNYLVKYKQLTSKRIQELTFEQVMSYWKEYVSDVKSQRVPPDPNPVDYQDLGKLSFWTIKMNLTTVDLIKQEIIKQVKEQLARTDLIYDVDYQLKPFDNETLKNLLNYDSAGNATIDLNINALATSTKAIGTNTIKIINNTHYDSKTVIDLSTVKFAIRQFNFSSFTIEQLKAWIFQDINQTFEFYQISLAYPDDYGVRPLDDATLNQFLTAEKLTRLTITIYAQDESLKAINGTTLELVNDPDAPIVPPDPPGPDPDPKPTPDPNPGGITASTSATWIVSLVLGFIVVTIVVVYLKYHSKKKGIGGVRRVKIKKK